MRVLPRTRTKQPSRREQMPEAPARRRLLGRGAGAQTPENGGGGGAERGSTTSATTLADREETGGSATASSETTDSSSTTTRTAPGDATTTAQGQATVPIATTRSTGGRGLPAEVRGLLGREEAPSSRPSQMGVVRLYVSSLLRTFLYLSWFPVLNHIGDTAGPNLQMIRQGDPAPSQHQDPPCRPQQDPRPKQLQKVPGPWVRSRRPPLRHDPKLPPRRRPPKPLQRWKQRQQLQTMRPGPHQLSQQLRGPLPWRKLQRQR
jgi:hypothetical protein